MKGNSTEGVYSYKRVGKDGGKQNVKEKLFLKIQTQK